MTKSIPNAVEERILSICKIEARVDKVYLFGSRARGDYDANSDIDLAVEGRDLAPGLKTRLREAAGLYSLDIVYLEDLEHPELLDEIRKDGILIYSRTEHGCNLPLTAIDK